ncbi:MAG: type IV pilus modification protein PilV [Pseudoalteromonas distincta]
MMLFRTPAITYQRGVGLLEVLIALLVLSVAALGFAGLQLTALNNSTTANHRAHAALIAQDTIGRIQSNALGLDVYLSANEWNDRSFTDGTAPPNWEDCTSSGPCTSLEMAAWDIDQVAWTAANSLPVGRVLAQDCPFNMNMGCVIVSWDSQEPGGCVSEGGVLTDTDTACFVMEVML